MKFSAEDMIPGRPGFVTIEYSFPGLPENRAERMLAALEDYGNACTKYNKGNPDVLAGDVKTDNENRLITVRHSLHQERDTTHTVTLKLPITASGAQLVGNTNEWQGRDYKTSLPAKDLMDITGRIVHCMEIEHMLKEEFVLTQFYKVWEFPVMDGNDMETGHTREEEVDDALLGIEEKLAKLNASLGKKKSDGAD